MSTPHKFHDEWLVPIIASVSSIPLDFIEHARAAREHSLASAALSAGVLTAKSLGKAVEEAICCSPIDLEAESMGKAVLRLVPEKLCRRHKLLPVRLAEDAVVIAMAYPADMEAQDDVRSVTGRKVIPHFCILEQVESLISQLYNPQGVIFDLLSRVEDEGTVAFVDEAKPATAAGDETSAARPPIIRLVNSIIGKAVRLRASDIHIEQGERATTVRYRIDGLLKSVMSMPKYVGAGPVISRLKIMADLDLADRLRPQDGRARVRVMDDELGLRISTLPTGHGEKAVIRILDPKAAQVPLGALGFQPKIVNRMKTLLASKKGMILVTGPTGSGKTTTLYAALNIRKGENVNVTTVEDPIEYKLEGINQVQINEKQGLTFSTVLRSVLRQDPDVIMVGEIRDQETADIAFQAALTGHLVFSTLHTNDAFSTISRLKDLGVEGFKMAPSLLAVTAQRLVRRLCSKCKQACPSEKLDPVLRDAFGRQGLPAQAFDPKGCSECGYSGFTGRISIVELLEIGGRLKDQIASGKEEAVLRETAVADELFHSMELDALEHVSQGNTSWDEILPHIQQSLTPSTKSRGSIDQTAAPAKKILVADADAGSRVVLRALLEKHGRIIEEVADGIEALRQTASQTPDLLLLAETLPGLDAHAVAQSVRVGLGLIDLPIVIMTEAGREPAEALRKVANDCMAKPVTPALVDRVEAALKRVGGWSDTADVMKPRIPVDESRRMAALKSTDLLDTPPEERFDRITRRLREEFGVPMSTLTLVDADRQWFKSKQGLAAPETPREISFCGHAINENEALVVEDACLDPRFSQNPLVTGGPRIRFYAGQPLKAPDGSKIGVLCILDHKPRTFTDADRQKLRDMAVLAQQEIFATVPATPSPRRRPD